MVHPNIALYFSATAFTSLICGDFDFEPVDYNAEEKKAPGKFASNEAHIIALLVTYTILWVLTKLITRRLRHQDRFQPPTSSSTSAHSGGGPDLESERNKVLKQLEPLSNACRRPTSRPVSRPRLPRSLVKPCHDVLGERMKLMCDLMAMEQSQDEDADVRKYLPIIKEGGFQPQHYGLNLAETVHAFQAQGLPLQKLQRHQAAMRE